MLKLWRVSQNVNNGYDTYDSAVVCAANEHDACRVEVGEPKHTWVAAEHVKAEYIGEAREGLTAGEIICASFNAG